MRSTSFNQRHHGRSFLPVLLLALTSLAGAAAPERQNAVVATSATAEDGNRQPAFATLQPISGVVMHSDAPSRHRIELVVHTDIGEPAFLAAVRQSVETHWNQAPAMLAAGLRIELSIIYVLPDAQSKLLDRLAQFPEDALVLTTGLRETPSRRVRSVPLAQPTPSGQALAREVGHLLGFSDGAPPGEATEAMVRELFEAYASEPYVCPCDAPK